MERRLAVILALDLAGFTAKMERDEAGTWAELRALRSEMIEPGLVSRGGKVFKTTGDGILAEFGNGVDAVEAATALQTELRRRYADLPVEARFVFRMGVDMGDVIVDGDDLFGDAVNVASRLEGVCEPGAVCISGAVFHTVRRNTGIPFEAIGPVELRNRAEPVDGYVWRFGGAEAAGEAAWKTLPGIRLPAGEGKRQPAPERQPLKLPAIAVLPFQNLSSDEEMGFLSSGLAEDITTELYRFKSFSVISRTSSFMYGQGQLSIRQIGDELGAGYVLEGSVRKLGERIRITAQLTDVHSDDQVWAERYDSDISEIFDAQDQIVARIVGTLSHGIERHRLHETKSLEPAQLEAYELMLRGLELHKQGYVSYEQAAKVYDLFSRAVDKDPDLARARAWKVCAGSRLWPVEARPEVLGAHLDDALHELNQALALDENEPEAHRIYGAICMVKRDFEKAKFHIDKAVAANPNNAHVLAKSANFYAHYCDAERAIELLEHAIAINPHHPDWYWQEFGIACWVKEDYAAAVDHLSKLTQRTDSDYVFLAVCLGALGDEAGAKANAEGFRKIAPKSTAKMFAARQPFRLDEVRARLVRQMNAAGIA
ncbi:MAG: tetratricopeptide repeat protein [Pseudomonadota bacterium]